MKVLGQLGFPIRENVKLVTAGKNPGGPDMQPWRNHISSQLKSILRASAGDDDEEAESHQNQSCRCGKARDKGKHKRKRTGQGNRVQHEAGSYFLSGKILSACIFDAWDAICLRRYPTP